MFGYKIVKVRPETRGAKPALSKEQVKEIRELYNQENAPSLRELSDQYNVSYTTIANVIHNRGVYARD